MVLHEVTGGQSFQVLFRLIRERDRLKAEADPELRSDLLSEKLKLFNQKRNQVRRLIHKSKRGHVRICMNSVAKGSKKFWTKLWRVAPMGKKCPEIMKTLKS